MLNFFLRPRANALVVCAVVSAWMTLGCARDEAPPPPAPEAAAPECEAYFAAFDRCFAAQGPEARAAASRALATARAEVAVAGAARSSRCREGLQRVSAACR